MRLFIIFTKQVTQPAEPQLYTNCKGQELHSLWCACGSCTIKPRHYRRALER